MKQQIGPKVAAIVIALVVVIVIGVAYRTSLGPTAAAEPQAAFRPHPGGAKERAAEMRTEFMGRMGGHQASGSQQGAP